MPKKSASYDDFFSQQLREDPELAIHYLNEAAAESPHALFVAVGKLIAAHKGMKAMEDKTGIKRQSLYKMLSDTGNPGWVSMNTVLDELGISIEFKYRSSKRKSSQSRKVSKSSAAQKNTPTRKGTVKATKKTTTSKKSAATGKPVVTRNPASAKKKVSGTKPKRTIAARA